MLIYILPHGVNLCSILHLQISLHVCLVTPPFFFPEFSLPRSPAYTLLSSYWPFIFFITPITAIRPQIVYKYPTIVSIIKEQQSFEDRHEIFWFECEMPWIGSRVGCFVPGWWCFLWRKTLVYGKWQRCRLYLVQVVSLHLSAVWPQWYELLCPHNRGLESFKLWAQMMSPPFSSCSVRCWVTSLRSSY